MTYGLAEATGPIHLVGHSYGGAIAFKIATDSPLAHRVRSLTLIEPVLPTLPLESGADRRLHDRFVVLAHTLYEDLSDGHFSEAIDKFLAFWAGPGSSENIAAKTRIRLIEHAEKLAFDFEAALGEKDVAAAAAAIQIPTLLFSGGLSPYLTQRIVQRLASTINGAKTRHLPAQRPGSGRRFQHRRTLVRGCLGRCRAGNYAPSRSRRPGAAVIDPGVRRRSPRSGPSTDIAAGLSDARSPAKAASR